jgi:hypothetical protein
MTGPTYLLDNPHSTDASFEIMQGQQHFTHQDDPTTVYGGVGGFVEYDKWFPHTTEEGLTNYFREKNYQFLDHSLGGATSDHWPAGALGTYGEVDDTGTEWADSPPWTDDLPFGHSWREVAGDTVEWDEPIAAVGAFDDSTGGGTFRAPIGSVDSSYTLYGGSPSPFGINRISVTVDHEHIAQSINGGTVAKVQSAANVYAVPREADIAPGDHISMYGWARIRCIWICPKARPDTALPTLSKVAPLKPW